MTAEALPNPIHAATAAELLRRLEAMPADVDEMALTLRVIVRKGIARRWKWNTEDEVDPRTV